MAFGESSPLKPRYDVFISYSRRDNANGWVDALYRYILADHRQFSTSPLTVFFDKHDIRDMDDWRHRILGALRSSRMLLICLSPEYYRSHPCEWEFKEYVRRQVQQLMASDSIAQVYFVTVPSGSELQINAEWFTLLRRLNYTDVRPWFSQGVGALKEPAVRARLNALCTSLWERLERARRAETVPGNLRRQNPHFLGRTQELRLLHERLGLGQIGVVTAVQGLGGIGKTELAVAYAHAFADSYPGGLWWLPAEHEKDLLTLIGKLSRHPELRFNPKEAEKEDPMLLGRSVLAHLQERALRLHRSQPYPEAGCLIVLDNVSEAELLSPAQLTTLPGGMSAGWLRIIATTRLDFAPQKGFLSIIPVDTLDEQTALEIIRDHQPSLDAARRVVADVYEGQPDFANETEENAARSIVRSLGYFTLAVEQVGIYLGLHPEVLPSTYLNVLVARGVHLADAIPERDTQVAGRMLARNKQLGAILDFTLSELDGPTSTALQFAALLVPDRIPWRWLQVLTVDWHDDLVWQDEFGTHRWPQIQRRLIGRRLLTPNGAYASCHRLIVAHLRQREGNDVRVARLAAFFRFILRGEGSFSNWPEYKFNLDEDASDIGDTILSGVFSDPDTSARLAEIVVAEATITPGNMNLRAFAVVERLRTTPMHPMACLESLADLAWGFRAFGLTRFKSQHGYETVNEVFEKIVEIVRANPGVTSSKTFDLWLNGLIDTAQHVQHQLDWPSRLRDLAIRRHG